jgi:hypothetical protein
MEPSGRPQHNSAGTTDVVARIDLLHAGISAAQRELLHNVVAFDNSGRWQHDGCRDVAQWLSGRLGISTWAAQRWVTAAHALERLPLISDALEAGTLGLDKVVELARFATPDTERKLIPWATRVSAAAIRRRAERAARTSLDEVRDAERSRYLRWWYFDDGKRMGLEGEFPAADGAAITRALRRLADRLPEVLRQQCVDDLEPSDHDVWETRCADALCALASQSLGDDSDGDRATVVVHTALSSVASGNRFSEIDGGPVIHPEIARRLACDARLQFVLTDQAGNAVGIGRTARAVPSWLMRQLRFRDHGCTFPGCGARAFLNAHHLWHWEDGGPTDLDNLVLVCHFHHKLVHECGWRVRLTGSTVEWLRPSGHRFTPGPDPPHRLQLDVPSDHPHPVEEPEPVLV